MLAGDVSARLLLSKHLAEFRCELLAEFRPAVKGGRRILKQRNGPAAVCSGRNQCLHRIYGWIKIGLAGRHHTGNRADNTDLCCQKAHLSDFPHIGSRRVIGKYNGEIGEDLCSSIVDAAIKSDRLSVFGKKSRKGGSIALVPAIQ